VSVIHYQEPLPLLHNIKPGCETTDGIFGGAYTDVDRQFGERATMQVKMIPSHLHPKL